MSIIPANIVANLRNQIDANTVEKMVCQDHIDGLGQHRIDQIIRMVHVGSTLGIYFKFSREFEGPNDDWEPVHIRAGKDYLFVFNDQQLPSQFWPAVEGLQLEASNETH